MKKVIIGLVSKHREIDNVRTFTYISDEMKNAIFENGAIAIGIIPPCNKIILIDQNNETEIYSNINSIFTEQDQENLIAQISLCDGVILSGGRDSRSAKPDKPSERPVQHCCTKQPTGRNG